MFQLTVCQACANKLNLCYDMVDLPKTKREGSCTQCFRHTEVCTYEMSPRRVRYRKWTGGGERNKRRK